VGDLFAEALGDLGGGDIGVFDGIVEETGGDRGRIHAEFGEDLAYFERVNNVRLPGGALLAFMLLHAEGPRAANDLQIVAGTISVDCLKKSAELAVDLRVGAGRTWVRRQGRR
jgi:hypothetical protein